MGPFFYFSLLANSGAADIHRLQALVAFSKRENDALAFTQGTMTLALDRAEVYENIITVFTGDKTEALGRVEPFDRPDFLSGANICAGLVASAEIDGEHAGSKDADK